MKKLVYITAFIFCLPALCNAQGGFDLPVRATEFLENHFPQYKIHKFEYYEDDRDYEIKLKSGHEIEFDKYGNWKEIDGEYSPIPKTIIDLLPTRIIQYISRNYPRRAIITIEKKNKGYEIELSNSVELKFDMEGNFRKKD